MEAFENAMLKKAQSEGATQITPTAEERALWVEAGHGVWKDVMSEMRGDPQAFLAKIAEARKSCM